MNEAPHEHVWEFCGSLRHPRMGWPVDFYICDHRSWLPDKGCSEIAIGDGQPPHTKPGKLFSDFESMWMWLAAP